MRLCAGTFTLSVPGLLRTHPLTQERVASTQALLPDAYRIYKETGCARMSSVFGTLREEFKGLGWS